MKDRVYIIHGWEDNPQNGWFPWIKKQLEELGCEVHAPTMPDPAHPDIEIWVNFLKHLVGTPDQRTFFIGHSIGCQTILRYLTTIVDDIQVGGVVLVAGWVTLKPAAMEDEAAAAVATPWLERPLNWPAMRKHVTDVTCIMSDDDQFVPVEDGKIFARELGAHLVMEHQKKHLSGFDGVMVLPSVKRAIIELLQKK